MKSIDRVSGEACRTCNKDALKTVDDYGGAWYDATRQVRTRWLEDGMVRKKGDVETVQRS